MFLFRIAKKIQCGREKTICHTEIKYFFDIMDTSKNVDANVQKEAEKGPI